MCFANTEGGLDINLDSFGTSDLIHALFAENPGVVVQVADKDKEAFEDIMGEAGVAYMAIGHPS